MERKSSAPSDAYLAGSINDCIANGEGLLDDISSLEFQNRGSTRYYLAVKGCCGTMRGCPARAS